MLKAMLWRGIFLSTVVLVAMLSWLYTATGTQDCRYKKLSEMEGYHSFKGSALGFFAL